MKPSLLTKLDHLQRRYQELGGLLSDSTVINDQNRFRDLSREYAQLESVVQTYAAYQRNEQALQDAKELITLETDTELKKMAEDEIEALLIKRTQLSDELQILLLPKDPNDERNIFLEIRAGAGGHEAALFAGDLFRMYARYAESKGWQVEIISMHEGEQGGYKEIISRIIGEGVYSQLKFESGAHRVQRVPTTESQGRIHTSTCTVAVLPEADEVEAIAINPAELRIDTFRASGAGGQHVNKTDSAIRITHIPSGIVVECQDERSQHKNRAKAMSLLQARMLAEKQAAQAKETAETRKSLVGTGDRSERIRTYNFPQGRVTDHRINLTLYKLDEIIEGDLNSVVDPLIREQQAAALADLANNI